MFILMAVKNAINNYTSNQTCRATETVDHRCIYGQCLMNKTFN